MITLANDHLQIQVASTGAELRSLINPSNQKEYIWQRDPKWWGRCSPVLFPIVGKVKNDTIHTRGGTYPMGQHGFVRDREFELIAQSQSQLTFSFKSDDASLKIYPYQFELRQIYTLEYNKLTLSYWLQNQDSVAMPFSIGAHPAFNCPLFDGEQFEDYYLEFEKTETSVRHLIKEGLFDGSTEPVLEHQNRLPLNMQYFEKDAIVFKDLQSTHMTLRNVAGTYQLKFSFPGFPYFGIWTIPGAPYICLEPWCGLADHIDFEGDFSTKEGVIALESDKVFERSFSMEIS